MLLICSLSRLHFGNENAIRKCWKWNEIYSKKLPSREGKSWMYWRNVVCLCVVIGVYWDPDTSRSMTHLITFKKRISEYRLDLKTHDYLDAHFNQSSSRKIHEIAKSCQLNIASMRSNMTAPHQCSLLCIKIWLCGVFVFFNGLCSACLKFAIWRKSRGRYADVSQLFGMSVVDCCHQKMDYIEVEYISSDAAVCFIWKAE